MKPEQKARHQIDILLKAAGWQVQDLEQSNLSAASGIAVREYPLTSGPVDYLLFVDRKPVGVVEAKSQGTTLSGVAEQSQAYLSGIPSNLPYADYLLHLRMKLQE
jgi:type I restriction enzyme, R subunit